MYTIKKAKLKEGELTLTIEGTDDHGLKFKSPGEQYETEVHPDCSRAFQALDIHLAVMSGFVKPVDIPDFANFPAHLADGFTCTQYSLGGKEDNPGVVLSGFYIVPFSEKAFNYNTPFYRFDDMSAAAYPFMDELQVAIEKCDQEIRAYLTGNKKGGDNQLSLFDQPAEAVTHMQIAEPKTGLEKITVSTSMDEDATETVQEKINNFGAVIIPKTDWGGKTGADPDAMARVKDSDHTQDASNSPSGAQEATISQNGYNDSESTKNPANGAKNGKRRVAQSQEHPSGVVEQ